jgi:hypothetical protein
MTNVGSFEAGLNIYLLHILFVIPAFAGMTNVGSFEAGLNIYLLHILFVIPAKAGIHNRDLRTI